MTDDDSPRSVLAGVLLRHIEEVYGGNQAEFARAIGVSPQHVGALLSGKIRVPRVALRRAIGRELGIGPLRLLVLAGEIDPDDPELPPDPPPALVRVVGLLLDPRMGPERLATVEAVARSLLAGTPAAGTPAAEPAVGTDLPPRRVPRSADAAETGADAAPGPRRPRGRRTAPDKPPVTLPR